MFLKSERKNSAIPCFTLMSQLLLQADFFYLSIYHGSTNPFSCTQVSLFGCHVDLDHRLSSLEKGTRSQKIRQ